MDVSKWEKAEGWRGELGERVLGVPRTEFTGVLYAVFDALCS